MGTYENILMIGFAFLTVAFIWNSIKMFRHSKNVEDENRRKVIRRKAGFLLILGFMPLFSGLYVVYRISWMFYIVFLTGIMATVYVVGSGVRENMKRH